MDRVRIIGVDITATNMDDCMTNIQENLGQARGKYICAANVHTTVMAHENAEYRNIQNQSYMTLPDGKPLSMVGKKRGFPSMGRVTGPGFMETVLSLSEQNGWTHYFYGNTDENIRILYNYLKKTYPKLNILGYEPSIFRPLSAAEKDELIERINECEPDFVWIGLGAPRRSSSARSSPAEPAPYGLASAVHSMWWRESFHERLSGCRNVVWNGCIVF